MLIDFFSGVVILTGFLNTIHSLTSLFSALYNAAGLFIGFKMCNTADKWKTFSDVQYFNTSSTTV